jgi:hypothetical protein
LDAFEEAICEIPNGKPTTLKYFQVADRYVPLRIYYDTNPLKKMKNEFIKYFRHQDRVSVIYMNRTWHCMQMWTRDDNLGVWHARDCNPNMEGIKIPIQFPI